jgi:hypothetical protein
MSNTDQLHAASSKRRLAEALARALLNQRAEQAAPASPVPGENSTLAQQSLPIQPVMDTVIRPPRDSDSLFFSPQRLYRTPTPFTAPSPDKVPGLLAPEVTPPPSYFWRPQPYQAPPGPDWLKHGPEWVELNSNSAKQGMEQSQVLEPDLQQRAQISSVILNALFK